MGLFDDNKMYDDSNYMQGQAQAGPIDNYSTGMAQLQYLANNMPQVGRNRINQYVQGAEQHRIIRQGIFGGGQGSGIGRGMMRPPHQAGNAGGGGFGMPGFDPSTMDPNVANQALAPYGMQLPTHINPFLFFNDQHEDGSRSWAGAHPKIARAVEGALMGASVGSSNTPGEAISNISRTIMAIPGAYKSNVAAQMQAPFDMAQRVAALQDDHLNQINKMMMAFHTYEAGEALGRGKPDKFSSSPYLGQDQKYYGYDPSANSFSPVQNQPGTPLTKIPTPSNKSNKNGPIPSQFKTESERYAFRNYKGDYDNAGMPKDNKQWNKLQLDFKAQAAGAQAGATNATRKGQDQSDFGVVPETTKVRIGELKDSYKEAQSFADKWDNANTHDIAMLKGKYPGKTASEAILAEGNTRRVAAAAAKKLYDDEVQNLPKSKITTGTVKPQGNSVPGVKVNPDGSIEVNPSGR